MMPELIRKSVYGLAIALLSVTLLTGCSGGTDKVYFGVAKDSSGNVYVYVPRCEGDTYSRLGYELLDSKSAYVDSGGLGKPQKTSPTAWEFVVDLSQADTSVKSIEITTALRGDPSSSGENVIERLPLYGKGWMTYGHFVKDPKDIWSYCDAGKTGKQDPAFNEALLTPLGGQQ